MAVSRSLLGDVSRALGQMGDARFLGVLLRALGLTLALLVGFAAGLGALVELLPETFTLPLLGWEVDTPFTGLQGLAVGAVLIASVFLMIPVSAVFVNLFVERIVDAVEAKYYPEAPTTRPRGMLEQLWAGLRFSVLLIVVNLLALALYFVAGPFAPFVFYAVNGYLLGREFFEVVAARGMSAREASRLRRRNRLTVWVAGTALALPLTVPVMNLVIPVLGVATFTHLYHRLRLR
ncbi:MAG: EI24 domain-containing protein [Pseudomonadota bacterium]